MNTYLPPKFTYNLIQIDWLVFQQSQLFIERFWKTNFAFSKNTAQPWSKYYSSSWKFPDLATQKNETKCLEMTFEKSLSLQKKVLNSVKF